MLCLEFEHTAAEMVGADGSSALWRSPKEQLVLMMYLDGLVK